MSSAFTPTTLQSGDASEITEGTMPLERVPYARRFRNKLVNGGFDFWSQNTSSTVYTQLQQTADRWLARSTAASGSTISRQSFPLGQSEVPGNPRFFHRMTVPNAINNNNTAIQLCQDLESIRDLAGCTATLSFWAKASIPKMLSVEIVRQYDNAVSETHIGVQKFELSTTWQKFIHTVNIPPLTLPIDVFNIKIDFLRVLFWLAAGSNHASLTDSLGYTAGDVDIAQVQLEEGAVVTQFEYRPLTLEFEMCQRFSQVVSFPQNHGLCVVRGGGTTCISQLGFLSVPFFKEPYPTIANTGNINLWTSFGATNNGAFHTLDAAVYGQNFNQLQLATTRYATNNGLGVISSTQAPLDIWLTAERYPYII